MKLVNNNIETLPIDMIVVLLKLLVIEIFQDFYNFFIAWARTQWTSAIVLLLESFPLRDLYNFHQFGSPSDVTCFDQFFRFSEQLGSMMASSMHTAGILLLVVGTSKAT